MSLINPFSTGALAAGDVLNTVKDAMDKAKVASGHLKTSSLVNITSVARVEPLAIIDSDSMHVEYLGQVLQVAHNIFTGYYLQAVSIIGNVGNVNVIKVLDKLNPNRKPDASGFVTQIITDVATESLSHHMTFGLEDSSFKLPTFAMEADKDDRPKTPASPPIDSHKLGANALATAAELSNLSVGKLIDVTLTNSGQSVTVPIAIRLIANEMPPAPMLRLLSLEGLDRSWKERWYKWRAGRIGFIKDLVLAQDMIREDKRAMMEDKTGILDEIMRRAKNNKLAGFFSKNASMNEASNVIVFSEETAAQLKMRHNIDVDNFKQRQSIFDGSYAMIMVKIDREWERVTFFINGQPLGSSVNRNELKGAAAKGSGTDLVEIFRALQNSNTQSIL